jgi:pimeloyl-ACP methyl ester carboxylesterase
MIETPFELPVDYLGPDLSAGYLPAFLYFSISANESLHLDPYNTPAKLLENDQMRVFSFTLPGHGEGFDKFKALEYWAEQFASGNDVIDTFLTQAVQTINWLEEKGWLHKESLALGGLSRGAFLATHLAARLPEVKTVLGFAPLTRLDSIKAFREKSLSLECYDLENLVPQLTHLQNFRFYIANHDTLVKTDYCYSFIRALTTYAHENKIRSCSPELFILKAIGREGHGTAPQTFQHGTQWIQQSLNVI